VETTRTTIWIGSLVDQLLVRTLVGARLSLEIAIEVALAIPNYVCCVYTHTSRVSFADYFIVEDLQQALQLASSFFFAPHPMDDDVLYLSFAEDAYISRGEDMKLFARIGNDRLYHPAQVTCTVD
jgi:hypothetical protein